MAEDRTSSKRFSWRLAVFTAALALIGSVIIAACVGDGDGDDAGNGDGGPTPSPTRQQTPRTTLSPTPTASPVETAVGMELDDFVIRPDQTRARPGTVTFLISNTGEVEHEFVVIRSDSPAAELPRLPEDAGVDESDLDVVGRLDPVEAGGEGEVSVDVDEGDYILICNLAPNGESHYLNGMYTGFEVRPQAPVSTTTATPTP
jgi:hypothetical protein